MRGKSLRQLPGIRESQYEGDENLLVRRQTLVAEGESVGTVIAGFAEPAFFGKAITGGICLATLMGLPAGCLVCNLPLAQVGMTADVAPVKRCTSGVEYVSLAEGTSIVVENVASDAVLCVDGNPMLSLKPADRVSITVRTEAVLGVRSIKDLRSS